MAWGLALGLLAVPYYGVVLFPVDSFADAAAWIVSAQLLGVWGETEKHRPRSTILPPLPNLQPPPPPPHGPSSSLRAPSHTVDMAESSGSMRHAESQQVCGVAC